MKLDKRLERVESKIKTRDHAAVLFVESEEEIKQYNHLIGKDTVVFIDDIEEEAV